MARYPGSRNGVVVRLGRARLLAHVQRVRDHLPVTELRVIIRRRQRSDVV